MAALMISCELVVDVDVPIKGKQVTANAFVNPDSAWSVHLNLNRHVLDERPFEYVNNAEVTVLDGDITIATLTNTGNGHFRSGENKPEPGKSYSLSVRTPGHTDLYATTSIPLPSPITNVEAYETADNQNTMVKVKIKDDGSKTNFYELQIDVGNEYYNFSNKQLEVTRYPIQVSSEDPAIQSDDDSYHDRILFKDVLFNGREVELTFRTSGGGLSWHGMIIVTLKTLSEDGYNYLRTVSLQDMTSGDPFAQPVNVYNNIQNGFGIFAGYSSSVYTQSAPKPVITSIDPPTGKPGDRVTITGENFIGSEGIPTDVVFTGTFIPVSARIVRLTPTKIEVVVPDMAVTGRLVVITGRVAASDSDFVVTP